MAEDQSTWQSRWTEGRIGFHQDAINPDLQLHLQRLTIHGTGNVLVPLAGKSRDMTWLAGHFDRVVGIEFVEQACRAFFDEQDLPFTVSDMPDGARRFEGETITVVRHDMLAVDRSHAGTVDAVWDRAALIALTPPQRQAYAEVLTRLLSPGAVILLVTLAYDQTRASGPPFSVPDDEVGTLFGPGFAIERLDAMTPGGLPPRFADLDTRKTVWLLTRS